MSPSFGQDVRSSPVLRAALWFVLKLAIAATVSAGVAYSLDWPLWQVATFAVMISLIIDIAQAWDDERRMQRGDFDLRNDMVGDTAVVTSRFVCTRNGCQGRVRVRGESWAAVFPGRRALEAGETIQVRGLRGLTLVVGPHVGQASGEKPRSS